MKTNRFINNRTSMVILILTITALFSLPETAKSQKAGSIPMRIEAKGNFPVGNQLVYDIREEIRKSNNLHLSQDDEVYILFKITTMPHGYKRPNVATIFSVVLIRMGDKYPGSEENIQIYMSDMMGQVDLNFSKATASGLIAETEKIVKR